MRGSLRGIALRMALGALTTLLLLLLGEVLLALTGLVDEGQLYEGDPAYYWTLKPNLDLAAVPFPEEGTTFPVRTNSLGLRDDELPESGPWVLALGCSTTFGWGVAGEQNWTELLERRLEVPVVNAGVPGHSTHQGLTFAPPLFEQQPTVVLMSWIVRDAQRAPAPDSAARPSPALARTRLYRGLKSLLAAPPAPLEYRGGVERVDPVAYRENLSQLIAAAEAAGAKVVLHAFPQVRPSKAHRAAMRQLDRPVVAPELPRAAFFENDPIHLNPQGHAALADQLETGLRRALVE